mgnify:CR=1 FL=1
MRVLHIIPSLAAASGGPSVALPAMASALTERGVNVTVATTDDDGPGRRLTNTAANEARAQARGWTLLHFPKQTEFYKVSLPLRLWMKKHAREFDLVHIHSVFSHTSLAAGRTASSLCVPYIVRPLGILNRWGMENRRRRLKALSFLLLDLPMLKRANAIHYTSHMEMADAARLQLRNLQRVIPIGIDLTPFDHPIPRHIFSAEHPETAASRNLLFLSRIDVKKGIDLLIQAFARIAPRQQDLRLIIGGDGDPALISSLKNLAHAEGVAERITWTGQLNGRLKMAAYSAAEIFTLPSRSENFGIALLEAMAAGLPCVSTADVALASEAAPEGAVSLAPQDPDALATVLGELLADAAARESFSHRAASLSRRAYSLDAMGCALHQLYQEIVPHAS